MAAEKLLEAQLFYDAASRSYYAALHYARALCLTAGEEPRSHQGVGHLLSLHYVRSGRLPAATSRSYALLQRFRESSDDDAAFVLDSFGAQEAVRVARDLVERFRSELTTQGVLPKR